VRCVETLGAWLLGALWVLPLAYAFWTAFHPREFSARFVLSAPLTLQNFIDAWHAAPFARYFVNTVCLVTLILGAQLVLCTLAAYAFARFAFVGRDVLFFLVLVQLMIMPDVLIVTNSVSSRPLTVGLQIFSSTDQGIDWSIITAATLMTSGPLLVAFLLFQRQFMQSFMRAGIR
jgi:ABC-type glycerol-3-phosphate transport system permease component